MPTAFAQSGGYAAKYISILPIDGSAAWVWKGPCRIIRLSRKTAMVDPRERCLSVLFEDVVGQCKNAGLVGGEGFAVDSSLISGDARRDRRVENLNAIGENESPARPAREYLEALDAGNPVHQGDARYLSPTDPSAAWNTKEGRGKFGYFNNYLVDTDHV